MSETLKVFHDPDGKAVDVELEGKQERLWTSRQHAQVMAAVRKGCANYDPEYKECLFADGGGCILETSLHPCCNYFRDCVLPAFPGTPYDLEDDSRKCERCGKPFQPKSNHGKYCSECAEQMKREAARKRKRKQRNVTL